MSRAQRKLIRRLKDREESAFRELIEEHRDRVFNLCFRMLGNREEAEDLAQEVFITVFKSVDSFRGDSKLSTWIFRIASNLSKNRIKYLSRRHQGAKAEFDEERERKPDVASQTTPQRSRAPDAQVEGQELEQLMQEAIAELDEDHRILIILRDIEELNYDEIVKITDLAEGTIKSRLHRARLALRKKMMKRL